MSRYIRPAAAGNAVYESVLEELMPYLLSKPIVVVPYDPQWPALYEAER